MTNTATAATPPPETPEKSKKSRKSVDGKSKKTLVPFFVSPIAIPLADEKFSQKCYKITKKATKDKDIKRGVKEVVKAIRKGQKGLVIMAADVSPMDVLSHLPVMCEDVSIPYVFVPSKTELGIASNTKRPTSCLMITPKPASDYMKYYDEVYSKAKATLLSA